jgi:hypothetical protein
VVDRPRPPRSESREIVELKQIKTAQPELTSAVDMQVALVEMQRRVQSRVPLPRLAVEDGWIREQRAAGRALIRFGDIPLDWTDFRLTFRQTADILRRFEAIDAGDHTSITALGREANALEPIVSAWYIATSGGGGEKPDGPGGLEHVLVLAIRPFLARSVEVLTQRVDLSEWGRAHCPFCGWEPEFAVIVPSGDRHLICGRCSGVWPFASFTCPFCANDNRSRVTSFTTRDNRYRVYGCDVCHRYIKAYDARNASRPVLVAVDTIATLPLDAAAMQRGYT